MTPSQIKAAAHATRARANERGSQRQIDAEARIAAISHFAALVDGSMTESEFDELYAAGSKGRGGDVYAAQMNALASPLRRAIIDLAIQSLSVPA